MSILEITAILMLGVIAWFWLDSLKAREAAIAAARNACESEGLILLDDTVAIASLKPARRDDGRLQLQRAYDFEYTDTGNNRIKGSVVMLGHRVVLLNVDLRLAPDLRTLC
jgi:Protein of unknown function (DUF3301)